MYIYNVSKGRPWIERGIRSHSRLKAPWGKILGKSNQVSFLLVRYSPLRGPNGLPYIEYREMLSYRQYIMSYAILKGSLSCITLERFWFDSVNLCFQRENNNLIFKLRSYIFMIRNYYSSCCYRINDWDMLKSVDQWQP